MKKRTIYTLPKDTEPTGEVVAGLIEVNNKAYIPTFARLESYIDDNPVMGRSTPNDILAVHNFAQYITFINGGYLLGNPVDYRGTQDQKLDPIMDNYREQNIFDLDSELEEDCSMFGQAFETVYVDEESQVLSAKLSVYNTIVVYDDTFKHEKMFAIYYAPMRHDNGKAKHDQYDLTIWTPTHIYEGTLRSKQFVITEETEHFFGEVPVVHYFNNKRMKGDYEPVVSLIDAYNILQSDRVIDREKLVDAILAFYGAKLTEEDREAIKDNRVIGLPEGAKAEYLIKSINEADTDVLRETIASDIHKFSMTPDLTDETFSNAPSGVSILYKLLAFEQNIKRKERQFESALKTRFSLYATMLSRQSKFSEQITPADIDVVFTRALPKNDFETSQMINNVEGLVDQETLIGQLSFVDDASATAERAKEEKDERMTQANFATGNFPQEDDDDES